MRPLRCCVLVRVCVYESARTFKHFLLNNYTNIDENDIKEVIDHPSFLPIFNLKPGNDYNKEIRLN